MVEKTSAGNSGRCLLVHNADTFRCNIMFKKMTATRLYSQSASWRENSVRTLSGLQLTNWHRWCKYSLWTYRASIATSGLGREF